MNLDSLKAVLLIRSLESSDRDGSAVKKERRAAATREAGLAPREASGRSGLTHSELEKLGVRGEVLTSELESNGGDAERLVAMARSGDAKLVVLCWVAGVVAFLVGAGANYLGSSGHINLLAIPLVGLIAWNLAVYGIGFVSAITLKGKKNGSAVAKSLVGWLASFGEKRGEFLDSPYREAAQGFWADWFKISMHGQTRKLRIGLHVCAMLMAAGVLVGMYLRGLGYEFKAGWESTFLSADAVESWLRALLAPGSAITGIGVPPGESSIAELDLGKGTGEKANRWIHLFAATTAAYIFVPRLIFVICDFVGLQRWKSALRKNRDLVTYYDRLVTGASGAGQLVGVVCYNYAPEPRQRDVIRGMLHGIWGGEVHVDFDAPCHYGGEDDWMKEFDASEVPRCMAILMNLNTTPEKEAHGFVLAGVQQAVQTTDGDQQLLLLLDEARFRGRLWNAS